MNSAEEYRTFPEIKERLDQIVEAVSDDDMPLDDALDLYEEAVKLATRVSQLIEQASAEQQADQAAAQDAPAQEQ